MVMYALDEDDDADDVDEEALLAELLDVAELLAELVALEDADELLELVLPPLQPARMPAASMVHVATARKNAVVFFMMQPFPLIVRTFFLR